VMEREASFLSSYVQKHWKHWKQGSNIPRR
jgi:hypothetical protein